MTFKDLLVHVGLDPSSEKRLDAALSLAKAYDAHLAAFYLVGEPYIPPAIGMSLPLDILQEQREQSEAEGETFLSAARLRAEAENVPIETRMETRLIDAWGERLALQARHADLVIVGQPDPEHATFADHKLLVEAAFMTSGRPALVIPYIGCRNMPPRHIMCAWDGSREAARAMNDALPLLRKADNVTVVVADAQRLGTDVGEVPGADIATHLARHGIAVEIRTLICDGISVGACIINEASDSAADLIVMGGYGHSRLRETVFGGTTKLILETMTVPVLLSH